MTKILLVLILGISPCLIWLSYFLKKDPRPEPRYLLLLTFLIGAAFIFPTICAELLLKDILNFLKIRQVLFASVFLFALIEEIFKFSAAYLTVRNHKELDEPVDPMIYCITAGLGFAAAENFSLIHRLSFSEFAPVSEVMGTNLLRFLGAILLHGLTAGITGYFWAKGIIKSQIYSTLPLGISIAALFHSTFNYLIIKFSSITIIWALLFLFIPGTLVGIGFKKLICYNFFKEGRKS